MSLPSLYIPHGGGPCFFMDWTMGPADTWERTAAWLRGLVGSLPERPKALLVVSAHWEEVVPTVTLAGDPPLLYDYYGFPPHTYALTWPAPGDPALARRVRALLADAGIESGGTLDRGLDHGVFVPLKVALPDADIPTVQLSLKRGLDPAFHLRLGRALAPLREEGVLILGSGMSFHDMRGFMTPRGRAVSLEFDAWLERVLVPVDGREEALRGWAAAPSGRAAHPREEHLLPLHVAVGAAGEEPGRLLFRDEVMGVLVSAWAFG